METPFKILAIKYKKCFNNKLKGVSSYVRHFTDERMPLYISKPNHLLMKAITNNVPPDKAYVFSHWCKDLHTITENIGYLPRCFLIIDDSEMRNLYYVAELKTAEEAIYWKLRLS